LTSRATSSPLAIAVAGLLGAGLLACASPARTPTMAYYTLTIPGSPGQALPGPVQVGAFSAEAPYASARLAYRTSAVRMAYYTFHRWAGSPPGVVAAAVRDYLGRAPAVGEGPPLVITGHIRRIEELDESGERRGILGIDFSVNRGASAWLERCYDESELASDATPEAVVMALSRALGRAVDRLLVDLDSAREDERGGWCRKVDLTRREGNR